MNKVGAAALVGYQCAWLMFSPAFLAAEGRASESTGNALPDLTIGAFSTRSTFNMAKQSLKREPICRERVLSEHRVPEVCGWTVVDGETFSLVTYSPAGPLLEIERYFPLPTGMGVDDVLAQAASNFSQLGSPTSLSTGPSLDLSKCSPIFPSRSDCAKYIYPHKSEIYGVEWSKDDPSLMWTLTVILTSAESIKGAPDFPASLLDRRVVRVHWENLSAEMENRQAVSKKIEQELEQAKSKRLKF